MDKSYKFRPLLKQTIWGGDKIIAFKQIDSQLERVGESWEVSGVPGSESVVLGGSHDGTPLNALVAEMGAELVGESVYQRHGDTFPLLVKLIDARENLSIQVHPDDATAHRHGRIAGKTEMWFALPSDPSARLMLGLKDSLTPDEYARRVADGTIVDAVASYAVAEGDCFFIPPGRIHAIGSGCFVVEVQQTSDVTYRIYDYGRTDADGRQRELHTAEAAESIDYTVLPDYRTHYHRDADGAARLVECPYFTTCLRSVSGAARLDLTPIDSFVVLVALAGSATLTDADGPVCTLRAGETVLLPATTGQIEVAGDVEMLLAHC